MRRINGKSVGGGPANLGRRASALVLALSFCLMTTACGRRQGAGIVVAGSTSVQPYVELLAETYVKAHPESEVDVQGGGSSAGITAVESGTADIGMSSRGLKGAEMELYAIEIAKDGLAIIVHPGNPVQDLTLEQVRDIYTMGICDWSELGGSQARVHVIAREEGSGTRTAFEDLVMRGERITPRAIIQDSNGAVRQLVSGDPNAIGFISLGLADHSVKALRLEGVAPTRENVQNESYSLHRPFLFVMSGEPEGLAKAFIDFIFSPEGQGPMLAEGLIPTGRGGE